MQRSFLGIAGCKYLRRWQVLTPLLAFIITGACERSTNAPPVSSSKPSDVSLHEAKLFADVSATAGVDFFHINGARGDWHMPEIMGSGLALIDYDDDGDLDIYLVQGGELVADVKPMLRTATAADQPNGNRLYQNQFVPTRQLTFKDVTASTGVGDEGYGQGVATGDIDNDGDQDILVTNLGRNVLYRNESGTHFTRLNDESFDGGDQWSTSASFFDYDLDGDLDLYIVNYVAYSTDNPTRCTSVAGNPDYCGPQNFTNVADQLFRNDGTGRFDDVSHQTGIASRAGPGLGVTAADFDGDGWPDLYVANDGEANDLWINQQGAGFAEQGLMAGVAYNMEGSPEASMGVAAGDYDGDGDVDLFLTHLINETNTLYANNGRGEFLDVTDRSGLGYPSKTRTGFGAAWFDFDNDGWLDLFVANGDVKIEERRSNDNDYPFDQPDQLFRNDGHRFTNIDADPMTTSSAISRGVATGDVDNDGFVDVIVSNNAGPARLFRNLGGRDDVPPSPHWIRLRLEGEPPGRNIYGARIAVTLADNRQLWRRVQTDGSYLSASDRRVTVGLGSQSDAVTLVVHWPDQTRERWQNLAVNSEHLLRQGNGAPVIEQAN